MSSAANAVGPMLNKSYPVTMLSKIPAAIMSSPVDTTVLMSPIRNFMAMTASTRTTARRTMLARLMIFLSRAVLLMLSEIFLNSHSGLYVMKLMHVHAKSSIDVKLPKIKLDELPKLRWGVVTTIQHAHKIKDVLDQLKTAMLAGQVLGCNAMEAEKIKEHVDAWLFVGSGEFHPIQVAIKTRQDVYLWNPVTQNLGKLDSKIVERFENRKRGQLSKFLMSNKVGIIVSTKMGQKNLVRAMELSRISGKEYFLFACDEMDMRQFENFPFIQFWVNTACPRIPDEADKMLNIDDLIDAGILKLEKDKSAYEVPIWMSGMGLSQGKGKK